MTRHSIRTALLALFVAAGGAAHADRIKNPTAVFSGLDKITGRIVSFEVGVDETVQFGALTMTPRVCFTRPPTESPNTTTFVEVDEIGVDTKEDRRIFTGWMFAASPGLHGIEHPVYDIWLVDCKGGTEVIAEPKEKIEDQPLPAAPRRADQGVNDIMAPLDPTAQGVRVEARPPVQPAPVQPQPAPQGPRFFPTGPGQAPLIRNDRPND